MSLLKAVPAVPERLFGLDRARRLGVGLVQSLLVITMNTAGLAGHLTAVPVLWSRTGAITAAAVVGSLAGARLVARIPATALRRRFGWFLDKAGFAVIATGLEQCTTAGEDGNSVDRARLEKLFLSLA